MQEIFPNALLFSEEPWIQLAALCRRICVLRAQGLAAAADQLHAVEFTPALAALRNESGQIDLFDDERVRLLHAIEQERVANAMLMAELIKSLVDATGGAALSGPTPLVTATPSVPPVISRAVRRPPPPAAPGIADLLDDMFAQETASGRDA